MPVHGRRCAPIFVRAPPARQAFALGLGDYRIDDVVPFTSKRPKTVMDAVMCLLFPAITRVSHVLRMALLIFMACLLRL